MSKITVPTVETTKDFILIKIPRNLVAEPLSPKKISVLERGLQESMNEVQSGKMIGPFRDAKKFLRALRAAPKG